MIPATRFSVVFLLAFLCVARAELESELELPELEEPNAELDAEARSAENEMNSMDLEEYDADLDVEARRARCKCPPPKNVQCKKNQKKENFFTNDHCKCPQVRCVWEVCPEVKDVQCSKCQSKVEIDDCGCKQFVCQKTAPDHCVLKPLKCDKCSTLEQVRDECGCPTDKCVRKKNPPSKCPCKECEECKEVDTGPDGCGLKESICVPMKCPHFKELVCNEECETAEFGETKCGCPLMKCVPIDPKSIKAPVCDKCHEAKKTKVPSCGIDKWECAPKRCTIPEPGKEQCFHIEFEKEDECGCPIIKKKKCNMVPAGDCPQGTVAKGGFDACGCPHEICVPCAQIVKDPKSVHCQKCEKKEVELVSDGRCKQAKCVPTAECSCPKSSPAKCGNCEEPGKIRLSEHCVVNTCVPSKKKECLCKDVIRQACGKCSKPKTTKSGPCAGVKTCQPLTAADCPKMGSPNCPPCQKPDVTTDSCGCKKFVCKKAPCAPMAKDMIKCEANQHKKKATIGLDVCKCPIQTCVDDEKVCEEPSPFGLGKAFGKLVLRNDRHSGVESLAIMQHRANVQTGAGFEDLSKPAGAWADKKFIASWSQHMKPNTKIRFTFWKREGKTATPVLDLIFRGAGSEPTTFFDRTRIEKIVKGPSGIKGAGFNYYGAKGHDGIKRHFFINKNYGGCQNDAGWVVVADKVEVCKGNWMGGRGWENFPRFLYAKQNGGCKWADVNCVGEGDVMTISIL